MGKARGFYFILFAGIILTLAHTRAATAPDADLKSDLELELELEGDDSPQIETKAKGKVHKKAKTPATRSTASQEPDARVQEKMDLAQSQIGRKLFDEAVNTLRPLNDVLPRSGLLLLAKAYAGKNDHLNELRTLELCIAKNPKDYVVKTTYGHALVRSKRLEDALVAFQDARNLNPLYRPAYEALLVELEKKGERFEARNVIEDMKKKFGTDARILTSLCRLYAADDYNDATKNACEQAIQRAPNAPENHMYLGLALMNLEKPDEAQSVLSSASKKFPRSEPVHWALGELAFTKKDMILAFNHFKRAASADANSVRAWIGYGKSAFELQKHDEALKAFVAACKLDRHQLREFRSAIGQLRVRKDTSWQIKYEFGINQCQ